MLTIYRFNPRVYWRL